MLINEHTAVYTNKVLLVPYEESHVITYHGWMKDEEIQQATASEPLSLDEEYAMQKSWRTDHDKLTFIICLPTDDTDTASEVIRKDVSDAPRKMIGDINLFLTEADEDEEGCIGEIEIMIAESSARGNGLGRSAVLTFLEYLRRHLERIMEEYRDGIRGRGGEDEIVAVEG
ncbi:aa54acff-3cc5-479a-935c-c5b95d72b37a [Sclerotinia trifoliorum]|uniref:Aa54acff-3cc5-479a-935c-c5b95d72b37a n=1 Tax=Sclerotinia trifoliorum TaxID=28548 RepID=A0A8H2ZKA7_9HELO|nr:aa54acff-3cc5-479a-935c-c5b95d72b37a [Sclerotinia trifoliorum]